MSDHDRVRSQRGGVCAVSLRLAPFEKLEPFTLKVITSALNRFAATSNDTRARAASSKNRVTMILPRKGRQFLDLAPATSALSSAMGSRAAASSRVRPFVDSRASYNGYFVASVDFRAPHQDSLIGRGGNVFADEVRANRGFAVPPVAEHG